MLMDLLHGFEVLSTTEETLFNSQNKMFVTTYNHTIALLQLYPILGMKVTNRSAFCMRFHGRNKSNRINLKVLCCRAKLEVDTEQF